MQNMDALNVGPVYHPDSLRRKATANGRFAIEKPGLRALYRREEQGTIDR
jgi:hypothetical protein